MRSYDTSNFASTYISTRLIGQVSREDVRRICALRPAAKIRLLRVRAFGGAIAPAKSFRVPRRYLATMATETNGTQGGVVDGGKRTKLHGRAFYESIGSPKLVLAPMVEQSEFVRFLNPRVLPSSELCG
jgi:hypothetical protein